MEFSTIFDRFKSLSGLENSEAENWSYLVYDSMVEIRNMLIPECDLEENSRRLTAVTAVLAFYRYRCVLASRGEVKNFKAGELSIDAGDGGIEAARKLYRENLSGIEDILRTNQFVFGRTESLCTEN